MLRLNKTFGIKMPIALVPPGEPIPVTPAEEPPIKRGRGRPPGSKNKPKALVEPIEEPSIVEPELPAELPSELPAELPAELPDELPDELPAEPAEASGADEEPGEPPPPPNPRARKPPKAPPPPPRERKPRKAPPQRPETPPETPRAAKTRLWGEYREAQATAHTQRRDHFSGLLGRFMH